MTNNLKFLLLLLFFFFSTFASSSSFINDGIRKCSKEQRDALLLFKHNHSSINYRGYFYGLRCPDYPILMNWNTSIDCCNWDGVTCNPFRGDVIGLDLSCGMLQGTIHPNTTLFHQLPHLRRLNLAYNDFTGQLPHGIARFSNSLTHLNISKCGFTGQVPSEISFLNKLVSLDLSRNRDLCLDPHVFNNLLRNSSVLKQLVLRGVNISSSVLPTHLNISSLKLLDLSRTGMTGKLPDNIFNLPYLEELYLSGNEFTNQNPLEISSPSKLVSLDLSRNRFPLQIQPDVLNNLLQNSSCLRDLLLRGVKIGWVLPPHLNITSSVRWLDLSSTGLLGNLPDNIFHLPSFILEGLVLNGNQLEGEVPSSLSKCQSLKVIDLGNNQLNGTFPGWLGNLRYLEVVILRSNNFRGPILTSSTVEPPFPNMRVFDLSSNKFVGLLPTEYFQNFNAMKYSTGREQEYLYYEYGGLYSYINVVGLYSYINVVDLSDNSFEGAIPNVIGTLTLLGVLNLSHNNLNGQIPPELGNLRNIEYLDLSWNQLTGEIPQSLTDTHYLSVLSVYQNHLVGRIPQGSQFSTFTLDSYMGNPKLCGVPKVRQCERISGESPQLVETSRGEESDFIWKAILLGYGCGILLGLVIGCVMLSTGQPKWFNAIADAGKHFPIRKPKRRYVYIGK